MNAVNERRHHTRYPANHLKVLIKSLRNRDSEWEMGYISTVDFNRFGIGIESTHNFAIGDILSLIIRTDDSTLAEVNGLICNRTITDSGFRFGVRFEHEGCEDEEAADAVFNISQEILMIERQAATAIH
ncbi:PilZ domain-containing protein [Oceanicoccus sp. KOV_DT_Chl]|uniref:PilZ domain-containing protein n=1 Tax=Oceanicoccus sp. KOV_DT_Chl TaxID=1904639 RepID=UPI001358334E|nr:PilZ domain-containing protein [Oceanicoccus sp. KOV_DT_Chl]